MLPGYNVCGECEGTGGISGWPDTPWERCPVCSGVGSVPADATVEAEAQAIHAGDPLAPYDRWEDGPEAMKGWYRQIARAALVAYAQHAKET